MSDELCRLFEIDPATTRSASSSCSSTIHPGRSRLSLERVRSARRGRPASSYIHEYRIVLATAACAGSTRAASRSWSSGKVVGEARDLAGHHRAQAGGAAARRGRAALPDARRAAAARHVRPAARHVASRTSTRARRSSRCSATRPRTGRRPGPAREHRPSRRPRPRAVRRPADVRETGVPLRDEYRYIAPTGGSSGCTTRPIVVADEHGEPPYVQGFLLDITERKQAEEERDRLRERAPPRAEARGGRPARRRRRARLQQHADRDQGLQRAAARRASSPARAARCRGRADPARRRAGVDAARASCSRSAASRCSSRS